MWFLDVILWQCTFGIVAGVVIGALGSRALHFSEARGYIQPATFLVFYFLLAILASGLEARWARTTFLLPSRLVRPSLGMAGGQRRRKNEETQYSRPASQFEHVCLLRSCYTIAQVHRGCGTQSR
jgi:hypothetical protein